LAFLLGSGGDLHTEALLFDVTSSCPGMPSKRGLAALLLGLGL